jgi:ribosomal protein S18 acetylase RimI-like enzyme
LDSCSTRGIANSDSEFLWKVLYYASHSDRENGTTLDDIKTNPDLIRYLVGWGRVGDSGLIVSESGESIGAAWVRLFLHDEHGKYGFIDAETPELAVAILPAYQRHGYGACLLTQLIEQSRGVYPGIVLTARAGNPAVALYERLGWVTVDEVANRVGTTSLRMLLDLTSSGRDI